MSSFRLIPPPTKTHGGMYHPLHLQLLTLILLNHIIFVIALPTAASFNLTVTSARNNSNPLTAVNFSHNVALGIAAAQLAYPETVPRLFDIGARTFGGPASLPMAIEGIALTLHITYPKTIRIGYRASWGRWNGPEEQDDPASFNRPDFDWAHLPLSFEDAQSKIRATEAIPGNRKQFNGLLIDVLTAPHPTLPIGMGELVYSFVNRNEQRLPVYIVWFVARSGEVFLEELQQATAAVATT